MGNAGSNIPRERHKSSSSDMPSSPVLKDGQAFVFDKKTEKPLQYPGAAHEEEEPYYTKPVTTTVEPIVTTSTTTSSAANEPSGAKFLHKTDIDPSKKVLPTVFKWDGGGKDVYISGTFSNWNPLPMVKSHGDFVTIIDLPEGEHQYKFCVDGEWKHDQKLVSLYSSVRIDSSAQFGHSKEKNQTVYYRCLMTLIQTIFNSYFFSRNMLTTM